MALTKNSRHNESSTKRRNGRALNHQDSAMVEVRDSSVHGRGVYATQPISKGRRIIEYTGKRMPWAEVPNEDDDPHTFIFALDNGEVINAEIDGNEARWINHSCDPNCEAVGEEDRIFIYALKPIRAGEELFYDYALELDEPLTQELKTRYSCYCRTSRCRGTMLDTR
jgi:uncharacterized protein